MRLLVDANALLRAVDQPAQLGAQAVTALRDPGDQLLLSAGTIWEIAVKVSLKKLGLSLPYRQSIDRATADLGMTVLPITAEHAEAQIGLPPHHRDPFDRLLVAQASVVNLAIVSVDAVLDRYSVVRIWG
jgi:PIN domain nuclease of toxin-antitoxin system